MSTAEPSKVAHGPEKDAGKAENGAAGSAKVTTKPEKVAFEPKVANEQENVSAEPEQLLTQIKYILLKLE